MSSLKVEERFVLEAEVARVWAFFKRPELVAGCLPGAKLDGQEGGDTFVGTMKVKVGPVLQDFRGRATMTEIDEVAHRMTISGSGDDKAGGGSASMTMVCQVTAGPSGGSEVSVNANVELAGKLVRFGRGMFEAVAKQLFKQFVERARTAIAALPVEVPPAAATPEPVTSVAETAVVPPAVAETVPIAPAPSAVTPPAAPVVTAAVESPAPVAAPAPLVPVAPSLSPAPASKEEALDAGSLFFTVAWEWLKGLWRRLLGRN